MSTFICNKCGRTCNSACDNNFWATLGEANRMEKITCSHCTTGITHHSSMEDNWKPWYINSTKDKVMESYRRGCGTMVNAKEYFARIDRGETSVEEQRKIYESSISSCEQDKQS